jgi:gamma-glutamyltranspeptidase/glutathione hydrolase
LAAALLSATIRTVTRRRRLFKESSMNRRVLSMLVVVPAVLGLLKQPDAVAREAPTAFTNGAVVSVCPEASAAGLSVLKAGGNAVDAAVATAFALDVTYPAAGNIGGGGFMLVHPSHGNGVTAFDYRETAPAAATVDMYAAGAERYSHKIVGVPGTVRGLELAHKRFGKLAWKDLVAPAIKLADDGFTLDAGMAGSLNSVVAGSAQFPELRHVFGKRGGEESWKPGERLVQPDLAKTLRAIAEHGADTFYTGSIADLIAAEMKAGGGLITKADLAGYKAKEREPIHGTYRGYDVYAPPPPSSGGVCLVEMLNVLEQFDLKARGRDKPETLHLMAETMRRAYCDRARYLGDPDFTTIPTHLTTKEYSKQLAASIDLNHATKSEALAPDLKLAGAESDNTTHFSVIDKDGMAVANTYTLEHSYGSRVVVRGAGFLLNNEMMDFNHRPGVTNRRGAIGTPPNQVAPNKRMLSSMTPTILAKDGKPFLITGSPGSRTIINTVLCIVVNVVDYGMIARDAVDAPRLHHQWFPDEIRLEQLRGSTDVADRLRSMGHRVAGGRQGDAHTILVDPKTGRFIGAEDRRIRGGLAGY